MSDGIDNENDLLKETAKGFKIKTDGLDTNWSLLKKIARGVNGLVDWIVDTVSGFVTQDDLDAVALPQDQKDALDNASPALDGSNPVASMSNLDGKADKDGGNITLEDVEQWRELLGMPPIPKVINIAKNATYTWKESDGKHVIISSSGGVDSTRIIKIPQTAYNVKYEYSGPGILCVQFEEINLFNLIRGEWRETRVTNYEEEYGELALSVDGSFFTHRNNLYFSGYSFGIGLPSYLNGWKINCSNILMHFYVDEVFDHQPGPFIFMIEDTTGFNPLQVSSAEIGSFMEGIDGEKKQMIVVPFPPTSYTTLNYQAGVSVETAISLEQTPNISKYSNYVFSLTVERSPIDGVYEI